MNSREIFKSFNENENKWSKRSVTTYSRAPEKQFKLLISEIEIIGDKNEREKETVENFFKFSLKDIKLNSSKRKSLTRFCIISPRVAIATYLNHVCGLQQQNKNKQWQKINRIHKDLRDNCVSAKKHKLFNKNS